MGGNFYSAAMIAFISAVSSASAPAYGQTIIGATAAVVNQSGPGHPDGSIVDTYNQNGLSTGYVSGVTDFDSYMAGKPTHTTVYIGFEWFANSGTSDAIVTYDLGKLVDIDRLALWNEEFSGIGRLNVLGSADGISFTTIGSGFTPTNNVFAATNAPPYLADVFTLSQMSLRYVRLDMSGCPQPNGGGYLACSIGEVAFRTATPAVPEPASWAMMIGGFGLAGAAMRQRRTLIRLA